MFFSKPVFSLLLLASINCLAAPMTFKGSTVVMGEGAKDFKRFELSHAVTGKESFGLRSFTAKGKQKKVRGNSFFYLNRLKRINQINSQTNLWLYLELGKMDLKRSAQTNSHTYLSPTIQFDYETKRIYNSVSHQILRGEHENFDRTQIKSGFSFYQTSYDETQPWFILEIINTNSLSKNISVVPTLRLINKSLFFEAGMSMEGDPKLHLMYTF
jgi:hypothetical protein